MAKQLFFAGDGINVNDQIHIIAGVGAPGSSTETNSAPTGSSYTNESTGIEYRKIASGAGPEKWSAQATQSYVDAKSSIDSWREPVRVMSDTAYASLTAAETAVNGGSLQSVALNDGDRILFTAITGEAKNVFIISGTPGAGATLVEDTNAESAGDTLQVMAGDFGGQERTFNSAGDWQFKRQANLDEEGYLRAFMGKDGTGAEMPTYSNTTHVSNGDNLEVAIGKLSAAVESNDTDISNLQNSAGTIQTELDKVESALGAAVDGNGDYVAHTGTNYINGNTNITEDLLDLDAAAKAAADAASTADGKAVAAQAEIDKIEAAFGPVVDSNGDYVARTTTNYLDANSSIDEDLRDIDTLLKSHDDALTSAGNTVTTLQQEVDFIEAALGVAVDTDGNYVAHSGTNYLDGNTSLTADVLDLDTATKTNADDITTLQGLLTSSVAASSADGVTTKTVIDSVLVDDFETAKWIISITEAGDPTNKVHTEMLGGHDGHAGGDATTADAAEYGRLRHGQKITGLEYDIEVSGTGAAQVMQLFVTSTAAVNVRATRLVVAQ